MANRFVARGFGVLLFCALLPMMLLPGVSRAQGVSSTASAVKTEAPPAQTPPNVSRAGEDGASAGDVTGLLTREYAAVSRYSRPIFVEKAEVPGTSFIRETWRSEWRAGDPFYFYIIRPKGVTKPPVILYLRSFPDDTDLFTNNKWCDLAVRGGYATVGFVGAVTAHRTRFRPLKEWFVSQMPEALTSTTHDVQLILDYLTTRGDLDMDHVAMYGMGSGGSIAILASIVDPRIKVLDLLAPWGDWKLWIEKSKAIPEDERAPFLKPEFMANVMPLDPVKWLPKVHAQSLRIEDIRGNKAMPDEAQERLEAAAPDFALINQYGNGRGFLSVQATVPVLDWVKSQLAADAKPQVAVEKSARIHFFPAVEPPPAPAAIRDFATQQAAKAPAANKEKEKDKPR